MKGLRIIRGMAMVAVASAVVLASALPGAAYADVTVEPAAGTCLGLPTPSPGYTGVTLWCTGPMHLKYNVGCGPLENAPAAPWEEVDVIALRHRTLSWNCAYKPCGRHVLAWIRYSYIDTTGREVVSTVSSSA
jgi:hypothetical protein